MNDYKKVTLLKYAIRKYGKENFKKEIIDVAITKDELNEKERYWIKKLNSQDTSIGYNIHEGGHGGDTFAYNPNKEDIRKHASERQKGVPKGPMKEETKNKISKSHIGENNPMYGIRLTGERNGMYGKHGSDKQKEAVKESNEKRRGTKMSEEAKNRMRIARLEYLKKKKDAQDTTL